MEESVLNQEFNRIKNLKNYKDKTSVELLRIAKVNVLSREFAKSEMFPDPLEQTLAEETYKAYLMAHELDSLSELETLQSLVYNQVFEKRLQKELNKVNADGKWPSDRLTKQLTEIQNQNFEIKIKLGIDKEKQEENELTGLQTLMKKFDKHVNAHRNEFTIVCPHGSLLLVRKCVKDFDSMPHPWFAGRWFFNYPLLKMVKDGEISKEKAWEVMCGASLGGEYKPAFSKKYCTDYIDHCLEHWAEITESLGIPQEPEKTQE